MSSMIDSSVLEEAETSFRYSRCFGVEVAGARAGEQFAEADDVGQRCAQLVGHVADELALQPVGCDQRLVALEQGPLVALGHRDVGERHERAAVGQRQGGEIDDALVDACHLSFHRLALLRELGDRAGELGPALGIIVEHATLR